MISATRVPELLAESLDLGSFLVNYGYDVTAWNESRKRIVQNIENKNNSRNGDVAPRHSDARPHEQPQHVAP